LLQGSFREAIGITIRVRQRYGAARKKAFHVFRAKLQHEVYYVSPLLSAFFFSSVLAAFRIFPREIVRKKALRRASAVTRWAPSIGRCCAASSESAATAQHFLR
jgi:hypothetical protein